MKKSSIKWSLIAALMLMVTPVVSNAMHPPEGFLPVKWAAIWWVIFVPFFVVGLKNITKVVKEQPKKKLLLALCGAFVFVLSALKIPSVTGSCSHPTGVGLAAILFGPSVTVVLWKLLKDKMDKKVVVFLAAALGDLATYTVTSLQLGLAFPDPAAGFLASAAKFLGIFFVTQVPIAIAEGLLTVIIYNFISENEEREVLA